MKHLLLGVGIAWLGFSKEGQKLSREIIENLKEKYLKPVPAEPKATDPQEEKKNDVQS